VLSRRQHSDQFKAEALAALDANGGNVGKTAKSLGIGRTTLRGWINGRGLNPEAALMRHEKKHSLADRLDAIAHKALDGLLDWNNSEFGSFKERMTGVGIAIDKIRLLRGQGEGSTEGLDAFLESTGGDHVD
jgi:hypothetical protein